MLKEMLIMLCIYIYGDIYEFLGKLGVNTVCVSPYKEKPAL